MGILDRLFGGHPDGQPAPEPAPEPDACLGCGAMDAAHPMVAVVWDQETRRFAALPVCDACHRDPAHRRTLIKGTFFGRGEAAVAVRKAGGSHIHG